MIWHALSSFSKPHDVVGINRRNVELVYAHNPRTSYRFADDKLLTKEHMVASGVPVPKSLFVCEGLHDVVRAMPVIAKLSSFVVKPASSSGGQGILVIAERVSEGVFRRPSGREIHASELRQHLAGILYGAFSDDVGDRAYIEERIEGHALMRELFDEGLCDIRVITLEQRPVMAMLRVPTKQSEGRANLHQGALGLALDLRTGQTFRALHRGQSVTRHPDTGQKLIGLEVPRWEQVLDVARRAAGSVPLGYLGVDIVLDSAATPLVLEVNARPGLEIQNVNGRGLRDAIAAALGRATP